MSDILRGDIESAKKMDVREWYVVTDIVDFTKDCKDCPMKSALDCKNFECIMNRRALLWYVLDRYGY